MSTIDEAIARILKAVTDRVAPHSGQKAKESTRTMLIKGNMRDERTFSQLVGDNFSGIRANDLWLRFEIWILGRIDRTLSYQQFFQDPDSLNRTYAEAFGIDVILSDNAANDIKRLKERKLLLGDVDIQKALQARDDAERKR